MIMNNPPFIALDENDFETPFYRQIYNQIRQAILSGAFKSKMRLPASRLLAQQLGVSRMTIINAYEQLFAEGYLEGKTGSGTFVAAALPEDFFNTPRAEKRNPRRLKTRQINFSDYGEQLSKNDYTVLRHHSPRKFLPFQHGITAYDKFPFDVWSKIAQKWHGKSSPELLGYGDLKGFSPLREAVAAHLASSRGVKCSPEQIIITGGTQSAVDLIARILLERGDAVWMEEPCYRGARDSFLSLNARISHIAVDAEGFDVDKAKRENAAARIVYVTPSHQYPLGATMSLKRRLSLLEWANANDAWILEDDYNSEFRYAGRPLASLQGLDRDGRVIYIGTFSKTIFPALRLGCLILPPDLVKVFAAGRSLTDVHAPTINQAILAEFISEGHFARHLRRMRNLYETRQNILVAEIKKRLGDVLQIEPAEAGMHLIGWLSENFDDRKICRRAAQLNLNITPVSDYRNIKSKRGGLLLGYTAFDEKQIKEGVRKLAKVFH